MSLSEVEARIDAFKEAETTLKEFMADHEPIIDILFELVGARNAALAEATYSLRSLETRDRISIGNFKRSPIVPKQKISLSLIPTQVLTTFPSLVKTIDEKRFRELVAEGEIPQELYEEALEEVIPVARVKAPKHFDVLLSVERPQRAERE